MIEFKGLMDGRETYGLSLTRADIVALLQGEQITVDLEGMEGPNANILLMFAEDDEEGCLKILEIAGLPPYQQFQIDPDGMRVRYTPIREG